MKFKWMERQKYRNVNIILKEKNKVKELTLSDSIIYSNVIVIMTV